MRLQAAQRLITAPAHQAAGDAAPVAAFPIRGHALNQQPVQHLRCAGPLDGVVAFGIVVVQVSPHCHPPLLTRHIAAGHRPAQPFIEPGMQSGGRSRPLAALPLGQLAGLRGHLGVAAWKAAQAAKAIERCHGRGGAGAGAVQKRSEPLGPKQFTGTRPPPQPG